MMPPPPSPPPPPPIIHNSDQFQDIFTCDLHALVKLFILFLYYYKTTGIEVIYTAGLRIQVISDKIGSSAGFYVLSVFIQPDPEILPTKNFLKF